MLNEAQKQVMKQTYDGGWPKGKDQRLYAAGAALLAHEKAAMSEVVDRVERNIASRMNSHLIEMKPDMDDSIVGFNEAHDVVREAFADIRRNLYPSAQPPSAPAQEQYKWECKSCQSDLVTDDDSEQTCPRCGAQMVREGYVLIAPGVWGHATKEITHPTRAR